MTQQRAEFTWGWAARVVVALLVASCLPAVRDVSAKEPSVLFDGIHLDNWMVQHSTANVADSVLNVSGGGGWIRTKQPYADFILRLEFRASQGNRAAVYLRAWPTFASKSHLPADAYTLALTAGRRNSMPSEDTPWTRVEIRCSGPEIRVSVDNEPVTAPIDALKNPQGYIGLSGVGGAAQFRNITLEPLAPPADPPPPEGVYVDPSGIELPKVLKSKNPSVPQAAIRRLIAGEIQMVAIIRKDGSVSDVRVRRSLDVASGLDAEVMKALSQWRFEPGRKDGQPVPVQIVVEMSFGLQ